MHSVNPYQSNIHEDDDDDSRDDYDRRCEPRRENGTPETNRTRFSLLNTTHSFFERMGSPFSNASTRRSQWDDYDSGEEWDEDDDVPSPSPSSKRRSSSPRMSRINSVQPKRRISVEETIPVPAIESSSLGFIDPWESPEPQQKRQNSNYAQDAGLRYRLVPKSLTLD